MARTLTAGLAKAKPAANLSLPSQYPFIPATSDYIHHQVSNVQTFPSPLPSLYMPGLDYHIEGQRVYHNKFSRTYFNISILQTLTHRFILSFAAISWRKLRRKWDPSRHKHRRIRSAGDARESPIDRMVDLGPISIVWFHHYSTICYRLLKGDLNGGTWGGGTFHASWLRRKIPKITTTTTTTTTEKRYESRFHVLNSQMLISWIVHFATDPLVED